jgi:hybrid cluster-associated redox disulfide protein
MSQKITRDMTFHQILQAHPDAATVLARYNMGCVGCMGAMNERLEQGAQAHGLDVNDLLRDLNALFQE